ncbi:MAG: MarR family winged helix-turn-helix transcriptional regulator [Oscillospiraceae bacterium]|jgi:DNA-binding MarR family transcriptional regulator|nr:MarR family winged helix-turn-helix transcriptional regulator [Oscillospiraceae bacterium]
MSRKKAIDPAAIDSITQHIFQVMPLIRKRLLHMDVIQSEHGIPLSHVQVLSMLNGAGALSVSEISNRLGIAKPNITPLVDRLMQAHLVDRVRDDNDRRVVNVVILEEGREKLRAIHQIVDEQVQDWAETVSAADFREFADALSVMTRVLGQSKK